MEYRVSYSFSKNKIERKFFYGFDVNAILTVCVLYFYYYYFYIQFLLLLFRFGTLENRIRK